MHRLMAGGNPMDRRNDLLSYPLRKLGPYLLEGMDKKQKSRTQLSAMALMAMAAAPTFFGNVVLPVNLISMVAIKENLVFCPLTLN